MSLLPSANFINTATGAVYAQFLWATRPVTIYKEPAQTIVSQPSDLLFGYSPESQTTNSQITLESEFTIYSGMIIYPFKIKNQQSQMFDNKIILNPNSTYVKFEGAAKDYILDGRKNEKLEFDSQTWNFTESQKFQIQTFCNLNFYYFEVKGTN